MTPGETIGAQTFGPTAALLDRRYREAVDAAARRERHVAACPGPWRDNAPTRAGIYSATCPHGFERWPASVRAIRLLRPGEHPGCRYCLESVEPPCIRHGRVGNPRMKRQVERRRRARRLEAEARAADEASR